MPNSSIVKPRAPSPYDDIAGLTPDRSIPEDVHFYVDKARSLPPGPRWGTVPPGSLPQRVPEGEDGDLDG